MSEFWAGVVVGAALSCAVAVARLRQQRSVDLDRDSLSPEDRDALEAAFAAHASAVREQVSEYADALASGDVDLRERLRRFERGDR